MFSAPKRNGLLAIDIADTLFRYELQAARTNPCWMFSLQQEQGTMEQLLHSVEQFLLNGQIAVLHPNLHRTQDYIAANKTTLQRSELHKERTLRELLRITTLDPLPAIPVIISAIERQLAACEKALSLHNERQIFSGFFLLTTLFEMAHKVLQASPYEPINIKANAVINKLLQHFLRHLSPRLEAELPAIIPDEEAETFGKQVLPLNLRP